MKTYHQILKGKSFYYPMQVSSFQISVAHFSAKQLKVFSQAKHTDSIGKMTEQQCCVLAQYTLKVQQPIDF